MKRKIAIIFGGANTEHEVSLASAQAIINHIDAKKFTIFPIKISKQSQWLIPSSNIQTTHLSNINWQRSDPITALNSQKIDLIFPVLHGQYGEDGCIQGFLETLNLPYVGSGVLASAICMDKDIQRQLTTKSGIQSVKYISIHSHQWQANSDQWLKKLIAHISFPCFVKPANQGSSIGISKAKNRNKLASALDYAFQFDHKVLIEQAVSHPREVECAIIGNLDPQASILGEIAYQSSFYDYTTKYTPDQAQLIIPANLPINLSKKISTTALKAYTLLGCVGLARVDFLLDDVQQVFYLSEVNTMPGFTTTSMYPKLWEASGVSFTKLLTHIIELGIQHHLKKHDLSHNFRSIV